MSQPRGMAEKDEAANSHAVDGTACSIMTLHCPVIDLMVIFGHYYLFC